MVAERATMGWQKLEKASRADQARRGYEAVANEYPSSPMAILLQSMRMILLKINKSILNWFAEQRLRMW